MQSPRNLFVTGFPGFLGSALVERLVRRHAQRATVTCLVPPARMDRARLMVREITRQLEAPAECVQLVEGTIARYDLGSSPDERGERRTTDIFHLEQLTEPAATREEAWRANVEGTRHVLDMAFRCPKLRRYHHLSSCYVSGGHDGLFLESQLQVGQGFRNAFEETQFLAELEVRQRIQRGLDVTIYRPTLVVGDGRDGPAHQDGLQLLLPFLFRLATWKVAPVLGDPLRYRVNVVPRDYVANAIDHLASLQVSRGRVYHLCDASPPTVQDLLALLHEESGTRSVSLPLPPRLARWAVSRSPRLRRRMGVSAELLDYVTSPTRYSSLQALRDLAPAHLSCPPLVSYLPRLLALDGGGKGAGEGSPAVA